MEFTRREFDNPEVAGAVNLSSYSHGEEAPSIYLA